MNATRRTGKKRFKKTKKKITSKSIDTDEGRQMHINMRNITLLRHDELYRRHWCRKMHLPKSLPIFIFYTFFCVSSFFFVSPYWYGVALCIGI